MACKIDDIGKIDIDAHIAAGWQYQDVSKMRPEMWQLIKDSIGPDNFISLSEAVYGNPTKVEWARGQFLISPQGRQNLTDVKDTSEFKSKVETIIKKWGDDENRGNTKA